MSGRQIRHIYVLGPPVQKLHEVKELVWWCLINYSDHNLPYFDWNYESGPLVYKVPWVKTAKDTRVKPGLEAIQFYAFTIEYWGESLGSDSFVMQVMDKFFFGPEVQKGKNKRLYAQPEFPQFETFWIIDVSYGKVKAGHVFEWFTSESTWQSRQEWTKPHTDNLEEERKQKLENLQNLRASQWEYLWDLQALFPEPLSSNFCFGSFSRRLSRGNSDLKMMNKKVRFDTVFPPGFSTFLARAAKLPNSFEELSRELYTFQDISQEEQNVFHPVWMQRFETARHSTDPHNLEYALWGSFVAFTSSAVQQLLDTHTQVSNTFPEVHLLSGVSNDLQKQLSLAEFEYKSFDEIVDLCHRTHNNIFKVRLEPQPNTWTIFRGLICTTSFQNYVHHEVDEHSGACCYPPSLKHRLVLLRWYMNGEPVWSNVRGKQLTTLHYIHRVDRTFHRLLFKSSVAIHHANGAVLHVRVTIGPWLNYREKTFGDIVRSSSKVIDGLKQFFCFQNIIDLCIPPESFLSGQMRKQTQKIFVCLGGPGTGKIKDQLLGEIIAAIKDGDWVFLASSLNECCNAHLAMLEQLLPQEIFETKVRVQGSRKHSELAKGLTLEAKIKKRMESEVEEYENLLTQLVDLVWQVTLLKDEHCLPSDTSRLEIAFEKLYDLHSRVAIKRLQLESKLSEVRNEIIRNTTLVLGTTEDLGRPEHVRQIKEAMGNKKMSIVALDEITRSFHFDIEMFIATLSPCLDEQSKLVFIGDPTQLQVALQLLPSTESKLKNAEVTFTTMEWLMHHIFCSKVTPENLIKSVKLVNRTCHSQRCREQSAATVSTLSSHCLPCPPDNPYFWRSKVDGQALWADLKPRQAAVSSLEEYLDKEIPEISVYDPMMSMEFAQKSNLKIKGRKGTSPYNCAMALSSSATALAVGLKEARVRWKESKVIDNHFGGDQKAKNAWRQQTVKVQILAPYKGMLYFTEKAVKFLKRIIKQLGMLNFVDIVVVEQCLVDASQGNTYVHCVLALPSEEDWTKFSSDVNRVITMFSRHFRSLALPYVDRYKVRGNVFSQMTSAMLKMQTKAQVHWTWENLLNELGIDMPVEILCDKWLEECQSTIKEFQETININTMVPYVRSLMPALKFESSPYDFRGCPSYFLRSIQQLNKILFQKKEPPMQELMQEVYVAKRKVSILAQKIREGRNSWFFHDLFPKAIAEFNDLKNTTGHVRNLLPKATSIPSPNTRLYSVLVDGLGQHNLRWCEYEWAMARVEWLCLELLVILQDLCYYHAQRLCEALQLAQGLFLGIAWAPGKAQFDGFLMRSIAPGAHDRMVFYLIAKNFTTFKPHKVLVTLYHTTNVMEFTCTNKSSMINPETRILCKCHQALHGLMDEAVWKYVQRFRKDLGLGDRFQRETLLLLPKKLQEDCSPQNAEMEDSESIDSDDVDGVE